MTFATTSGTTRQHPRDQVGRFVRERAEPDDADELAPQLWPSRSFAVGDRTVFVERVANSAGRSSFRTVWSERPTRLTGADIELFDRCKRQAIAELLAEVRAGTT